MDKEDFIIKVHHVGGIDECGPVDALISLKKNAKWYVYDADNTSLNQTNSCEFKDMVLINKCIGDKDGKTKFYIVANTTASSCLPCEPKAKKYYYTSAKETWGDHVKIKKIIDIEMNKLSTLIKNKETTIPDFLSVDVQGLELNTIMGCGEYLDDVLGIICEVEFRKLYKGQYLFRDTDKFLSKNKFIFQRLYNLQTFNHTKYSKDKGCEGFLCVAEALYLKDHNYIFKKLKNKKLSSDERGKFIIQLLKLAMFSLSFNMADLSREIINKLDKIMKIEDLSKEFDVSYLRTLLLLKDDKLDVLSVPAENYLATLRESKQ